MSDKGIVVVGRGGQAKALTDVINSIVSYSISQGGRLVIDKYVDYNDLEVEPGRTYIIGFGSLKNLRKRMDVADEIESCGGRLATIIAPTAYVSPCAKIGPGTVVMHQAFVGPGADVGSNCLINTKAIVEHDTVVGRDALILTAATVNGGCVIGERCMIGSNATLLHGIMLTDDVMIGAGAVVVHSITEPGSYVGVPARRVSY